MVGSEIVQRASPTMAHGGAQMGLGTVLAPARRRSPADPSLGWWLGIEVDVLYQSGDVYRHDAAGFRRAHHAQRPTGLPVTVRPDWVAEILSPSTAHRDVGVKLQTLFTEGVPHYWIVDPANELLTVFRRESTGYVVALIAGVPDRVRAEPFVEIEIAVAALFDRDPDDRHEP